MQLKICFNSKPFTNLIFQDLSPLLLLRLIAKAGGLLAKVHPLAINPATNPAENRTTKPRKAGPNRETTDRARGRVTATTDLGRGGETARRGRRGEETKKVQQRRVLCILLGQERLEVLQGKLQKKFHKYTLHIMNWVLQKSYKSPTSEGVTVYSWAFSC